MSASIEIAPGAVHYPAYLDRVAQEALRDDLREIVRAAPLFQPRMPRTGKAFSVRMTNCGPLGWVSDIAGYRYQPRHPDTGAPWPDMPGIARRAWGQQKIWRVPPVAKMGRRNSSRQCCVCSASARAIDGVPRQS